MSQQILDARTAVARREPVTKNIRTGAKRVLPKDAPRAVLYMRVGNPNQLEERRKDGYEKCE